MEGGDYVPSYRHIEAVPGLRPHLCFPPCVMALISASFSCLSLALSALSLSSVWSVRFSESASN